jgi:hypothetical protein
VQLHVVEELFGLLDCERETYSSQSAPSADLSAILDAALHGVKPPLTIHLRGVVHQHEVLMLVDSGSTHSLISESLAAQWPGVQHCRPMHVKVADGGMLCCDLAVPDCAWEAQGVRFNTTLRLFPLGCYDIILGMDWLQGIGDMNVNWLEKRMPFKHQGSPVQLQGLIADTTSYLGISFSELEALEELMQFVIWSSRVRSVTKRLNNHVQPEYSSSSLSLPAYSRNHKGCLRTGILITPSLTCTVLVQ